MFGADTTFLDAAKAGDLGTVKTLLEVRRTFLCTFLSFYFFLLVSSRISCDFVADNEVTRTLWCRPRILWTTSGVASFFAR